MWGNIIDNSCASFLSLLWGVPNIHMQMYAPDYPGCPQNNVVIVQYFIPDLGINRRRHEYVVLLWNKQTQIMGRLANKKYQESNFLLPKQGELNHQKQWTQR